MKTLIRKMIKNLDSVSPQEIDILLPVLMFSTSLHQYSQIEGLHNRLEF